MFETEGDMKGARGYMQRGLRFCEQSRQLWLEYAELEMRYLDKLARRRRILGLDTNRAPNKDTTPETDDMDDNTIALPSITAEDMNPELAKSGAESEQALKDLAATPVFSGGIPIAIFDAAMKKFKNDVSFASPFFDMIADFVEVPSTLKILQHILDTMRASDVDSMEVAVCDFKLPCIGVPRSSAEFPAALGESLQCISSSLNKPDASKVAEQAVKWVLPVLMDRSLDENIAKVVNSSLRRYLKVIGRNDSIGLIQEFITEKQTDAAKVVMKLGSKQFGFSEEMQQLQIALDMEEG